MTADPRPAPPEHADRDALAERITQYLSAGGLVNPESMEHAKVRDLLIGCRAILAAGFARTPESASANYLDSRTDAERAATPKWVAPLRFCPSCKGSLSWEETTDLFDVPFIIGRCKVCRFGASIYFPAPPPSVGAVK